MTLFTIAFFVHISAYFFSLEINRRKCQSPCPLYLLFKKSKKQMKTAMKLHKEELRSNANRQWIWWNYTRVNLRPHDLMIFGSFLPILFGFRFNWSRLLFDFFSFFLFAVMKNNKIIDVLIPGSWLIACRLLFHWKLIYENTKQRERKRTENRHIFQFNHSSYFILKIKMKTIEEGHSLQLSLQFFPWHETFKLWVYFHF